MLHMQLDDLPAPVPVTVLSGFLGAGKTTVLNRLLGASDGRRIAVIVNDIGEVNIDADLLRRGALKHVEAEMVEMHNGCICCTLRGDLLDEITRLASLGFDHIVIESTGIGEPLAIAETFEFALEDGSTLGDVAAIDAMITLVDGVGFLAEWKAGRSLAEVGQSLGPEDGRSITDLLVAQVEFANVLVISKTDLATADNLNELEAILRVLNPEATIIRSVQGNIPLTELLDTGAFDMEEARRAPGWMATLREDKLPETLEYGIATFVYRARRPFHSERVWAWLNEPGQWDAVLRSKGFFWLCTRMDVVGAWSQAGGSAACEVAGTWFAATPMDSWPSDPEILVEVNKTWVDPWGDRRQELVFIGQHLDRERISASLDTCLLTDEELAEGEDAWSHYPDPFPAWTPSEVADASDEDGSTSDDEVAA